MEVWFILDGNLTSSAVIKPKVEPQVREGDTLVIGDVEVKFDAGLSIKSKVNRYVKVYSERQIDEKD